MGDTQGQASRVHYVTGLLAPDLKHPDVLGRLGPWIYSSMVQHSPCLYMALGSISITRKKKRQQNKKRKDKVFCCILLPFSSGKINSKSLRYTEHQ